nr:unnamed protein product [Callosobruchus analis]
MLLYLPFINLVDERNLDTGTFKYVMTFLPYQTMATQLGFYLYTLSTDEILLEENSSLRRLLKNVGLSPFGDLDILHSVCWFGPEVIMIAVSILYTWAVKLIAGKEREMTEDADQLWLEKYKYLKISASTVFLLWAAMWHHCMFGVCYFVIFLFFMSVWALNKSLINTLSIVLFFCMPISMMHTIGQYIFQIEQIQHMLADNKKMLRLVGIDQLLEPEPTYGPDYTHYRYFDKDIVRLLYPIIVYVLYYFMVNEAMMLNSLNRFLTEEKKRRGKWSGVNKKMLEMANTDNLMSLIGESTRHKIWRYTLSLSKNVVALIVKYSYVGTICAYMRKFTVYSCFLAIAFSYANTIYLYLAGIGDGAIFSVNGILEKKDSIVEKVCLYFLERYWIVAIALFIISWSVSSKTVRIFRIVHMFEYLSFMFILQLSFRLWRKLLLAFWVMMITVTLLIMMVVYGYQMSGGKDWMERNLRLPPTLSVRLAVMYWAAILVSVSTMASLIYALRFFDSTNHYVTCHMTKHPEINETTSNLADWLGTKTDQTIIVHLAWETAFVLVSCLRNVVIATQKVSRKQKGLPTAAPKVMFPEVTYREADLNLKNYINLALPIASTKSIYSSMGLGLVCHICRSIDNMAVYHGYWTTTILVHGYAEYEWETRTYYWTVAQDFWFLADNYHPPPIKKLIPESILLIMASQLMIGFWREMKNSKRGIDYDGGSNSSVISHFEEPGFVIPVTDFTTYTTSYLDLAKRIFINVSYWGCIWLVFLGSVNRVNIFSIIYLCYVFIYLWHVIGCFYMPDIPMDYCGLIRLFGIGCVRNFEETDYFDKLDEGKTICKVSKSEMSGIEWDAAIFYFLMIQRRVFCSYNFFHIVNDAKAQHVLSARGANILDELFDKRIKTIKDEERRVRQAVETTRAGDYYMFEDNETDVEEQLTFKQKEEEKQAKQKKQKRNLISFCWAAINVLIVNTTAFFEKYTKTYDMVRDELNKERRQLKKPKRPPKEMSTTDLPDFMKLLKALWIIIVARSDLLCYVCVIMNQVMQCQLITLPLCAMVYMWGMLSNPRPSKTFWIIMIGYVEMVIFLKCIFQFGMMPGNSLPNEQKQEDPMQAVNPFFPTKFMGLLAMQRYYIWEMFILIAIVIHRYYLTNIGLWTTVTTSFTATNIDGLYSMKNGELVRTLLSPNKPTTSTAANNEYVILSYRTSTLDNLLLSIRTITLCDGSSYTRRKYDGRQSHLPPEEHGTEASLPFTSCLIYTYVDVSDDSPLHQRKQIRVGYPSRIWGFYCCHSYGIWNYINITGYLIVPFLFELRSSFDWMFTDTTMSIFDWFKMEEIYTSVYKVKCLRGIEEEYCGPRSVKKKLIYKYLYGIILLIMFLTIIWFPIMVYSWGRVAGQSNPPSSATLKFQIGDATPIYENKAHVYKFTFTEYEYIQRVYNPYDVSKEFLYDYDHTDVTALAFRSGGATWMIRKQELEKLLKIIHGADDAKQLTLSVKKMLFPYSYNRLSIAKMMIGEQVEDTVKVPLFLFVIHGWSRNVISWRIGKVWLYEAPQADILYALCKEVYICREANMWELEEVASSRVFFMIRSGDTAYRLSRFHGSPYNPNTNKTMPPVTRRT